MADIDTGILRPDIIQLLIQAASEQYGDEERMALSREELDKRIADQEYMGIRGSVLIKHYPYLLDYPPRQRKKKMCDLAIHEHKQYFLAKSLGFDPTQLSLAYRVHE